MAKAIDNKVGAVFVDVTDLRRAAEWYSKLFGLPVLEERLNGGPVYWFSFEGTHLILDSNESNRNNPEWREEMKPRLMLNARQIDEAYARVRDVAEVFDSEPERHEPVAFFTFRDSEGNVLMACWSAETEESLSAESQSPIIPGIGGAFLDVKDMKSAARWYSELLGVPFDESKAEQAVYAVPTSSGAALLLDANRHLNKETYTELFYAETKNFEAALAYVREQGFQLAGEPMHFPDLSEFALLDPDGNRIVIAMMKEA